MEVWTEQKKNILAPNAQGARHIAELSVQAGPGTSLAPSVFVLDPVTGLSIFELLSTTTASVTFSPFVLICLFGL